MAQLKIPKRKNTQRELTRSDFNGGLNYRDNASLISPNQSPQAQNVRIRDGTLNQRPGYRKLYPTSLGAGKINGASPYIKANGSKYRLIAHGTSLYTQAGSSQPVSIKSGLANAKTAFFVLSDTMYMLNGTNYLSFDGTTCSDVVGYVPTILIGRSPSGAPNAGEVYENFNLISAGFKISFTADGTSNAYHFPFENLDATAMTASVNGVAMAETTNFTVNRTTGVVTFNVIPADGNPDNVVITAYKASLSKFNHIKNCTIAEVYGGKTSATVFFTGNPSFPDQVWHTRLYGENYSADYFPDDAWQKLPGNIVGLSHLYDYLYIVHSNGHGALSYTDGPGGYPIFPYSDINSEKGSNIPGSIQEINNSVLFASRERGVMKAVADTTVNNFLSVNDLSDLINKGNGLGLLLENNLENAISYNHDGYYGLCINNVCYVWDYKANAWLYDTNIPASCFTVIDNTLCFGSNTDGLIYQFDDSLMNDNGVAIDARWKTKKEDGGSPTKMKTMVKLTVAAKPLEHSSATILFLSKSSIGEIILELETNPSDLVVFPIIKRKKMSKRANYFQYEIKNNVLGEGLSIIFIKTEFNTGSELR